VEARWEDIYEANSWAIGRDGPRMLKAGQVLTLPD
jgi:nucleoid-associated protein YgaU